MTSSGIQFSLIWDYSGTSSVMKFHYRESFQCWNSSAAI